MNVAKYYDESHKYYQKIWGNNISVGLYHSSDISIKEASNNTLNVMIALFNNLESVNILDLGSGSGETARYLAKKGAHLTCLNISQVQNDYNIQCNKAEGLEDKIKVVTGSFEEIPCENDSFDIVISRDSLMYSGNRKKVFLEVMRVLKSSGDFVFTDFLRKETINSTTDLYFIENDPYVHSLESFLSYKTLAETVGFQMKNTLDLSHHFAKHYKKINENFELRKNDLEKDYSNEEIEFFVQNNVNHRIAPCEKGDLKWGVLHFSK